VTFSRTKNKSKSEVQTEVEKERRMGEKIGQIRVRIPGGLQTNDDHQLGGKKKPNEIGPRKLRSIGQLECHKGGDGGIGGERKSIDGIGRQAEECAHRRKDRLQKFWGDLVPDKGMKGAKTRKGGMVKKGKVKVQKSGNSLKES